YSKMNKSPLVGVFVGPEKKHFSVPQDLLTHLSPYFDAAFSGNYKEGITSSLGLDEDNRGDFEVLQDFVVNGNVLDILTVDKWGDEVVERCIGFLVYANKCLLGPVDEHVYEPHRPDLVSRGSKGFRGAHTERVFGVTAKDSSLRGLITHAALSFGGARKGTYREQELKVDGFAAELLRLTRECVTHITWNDPLRVPKPGKPSDRRD
ncbi:hypothetical protein BKA61DRAFT_470881, partial [Leptodontidium sp. MPI-SDFR-AT-0119]